ncbi:hypothetical protein, partial [Kitasatospora sp. NPDC056184]|uniref:hypothetical protein n=1 Tax=Kitasatospora sp. NPDC056184 TaxID=3345738 RepID=UPI0035DFC371
MVKLQTGARDLFRRAPPMKVAGKDFAWPSVFAAPGAFVRPGVVGPGILALSTHRDCLHLGGGEVDGRRQPEKFGPTHPLRRRRYVTSSHM